MDRFDKRGLWSDDFRNHTHYELKDLLHRGCDRHVIYALLEMACSHPDEFRPVGLNILAKLDNRLVNEVVGEAGENRPLRRDTLFNIERQLSWRDRAILAITLMVLGVRSVDRSWVLRYCHLRDYK